MQNVLLATALKQVWFLALHIKKLGHLWFKDTSLISSLIKKNYELL